MSKTAMQTAVDFLENELKSLRWSNTQMVIMGFAGREFQLAKDISYLKTLLEEEKNQLIDAWETGELFGERAERDGMNHKRINEVRNEFITGKTYSS